MLLVLNYHILATTAIVVLLIYPTSVLTNNNNIFSSTATPTDIEKLYSKGHKLFVSGRFTESEEVWKQLIKILPQTEVVWTNLATTFENQGKYEDAFNTYREALTKISEEINVYINLCSLRTKQFMDATIYDMGNTIRSTYANDAKIYCQKAITVHPTSVKAWQTIGMLHTEIFEYDKAVSCLKMAINLDPNDGKSNLFLSTAYSRMGDLENAVKQSQNTIKVAPNAESYNSDGIIRSVCTLDTEGKAIVSHQNAIILHAAETVTKACPSGYNVIFGWEDVGDPGATVTTIERGGDQTFGQDQPRLPDPKKVSGNDKVNTVFLKWKEQDIVLVKLTNVFVEGNTGIFYRESDCKVFTGGHKQVSKIVHEFMGGVSKTETVSINEPVASILQQNPGNYYHWTAESSGRLLYLIDHFLSKPENVNVKILVPKMAEHFVRETVQLLGFPESRLIWYDRREIHIRYFLSTVYLIDWHWNHESDLQPFDLSGRYFPPRQVLNKLRKRLGGHSETDTHHPTKPLKLMYISREDATVRKINSDDERKIIVLLMDLVGPENVEWVSATDLKIKQQIDMFKDASIIVAPHGAGLTNMLWTKKGTSVVQFPMNPNTDNCFGYLSMSLGLDYWIVPQINSYYYGQFGSLDDSGIRAIQNVIETIIEEKKQKTRKGPL